LSSARALANQKLYFASLHLRMLARELAGEDVPASLLLEAVGQSVQMHLQDAYGWFLLELGGIDALPKTPPNSVAAAHQAYPQIDLSRGEMIELQNLEQRAGWLQEMLLQRGTSTATGPATQPDGLSLVETSWNEQQLQNWAQKLSAIIERMSDSLDEW
jgi:hypothetical protein